jgi:hypothetical protein
MSLVIKWCSGDTKAWLMRRSKFPYVVEIAGPVRGVRKVAIYAFHARLGIGAH